MTAGAAASRACGRRDGAAASCHSRAAGVGVWTTGSAGAMGNCAATGRGRAGARSAGGGAEDRASWPGRGNTICAGAVTGGGAGARKAGGGAEGRTSCRALGISIVPEADAGIACTGDPGAAACGASATTAPSEVTVRSGPDPASGALTAGASCPAKGKAGSSAAWAGRASGAGLVIGVARTGRAIGCGASITGRACGRIERPGASA